MHEPIIFTTAVEETLQSILNDNHYSKVGVLVDENTETHCLPMIDKALSHYTLIKIKSGEIEKNLSTCAHIWQAMTDDNFDRKSLLINLGGGVIGDMGGFCAGTFKRGIDFINIPTTLLSQVDASVGGKLGIDFQGFKNHIGLFQDPRHVVIDFNFLNTLPLSELRSGFAEVIKHNLIADIHGWSGLVKTDYKSANWNKVIPHSVKIKSDIVKKDPKEGGLRKALNFGHTIGHAVESYRLNSSDPILHGEAVALGMICEAYISQQRGLITSRELEQINTYVLSIFDKIQLSDRDREDACALLTHDKKNEGNAILCVLLNSIGNVIWDQPIDIKTARESLDYYHQL